MQKDTQNDSPPPPGTPEKEPKRTGRLRRFAFRAMILVPGGLLIAFLVFEIVLRVQFDPYSKVAPEGECAYTADDELGWVNGHTPGVTNSGGFRNTVEFAPGKPPHRRIMFFGDSILFFYQDRENPGGLTDRLDRLAKADGRKVDFVNASSPGYSTYQQLLLMRRHVPAYRPDLVVIGYCLNDTYPTSNHFLNLDRHYDHWQLDASQRERLSDPKPQRLSPLLTVRWIRQHVPRMLRALDRAGEDDIAKRFYDGGQEPGPQHEVLLDDLREAKKLCDENGADFMIVVFPRRREVEEGKRLKDVAFLQDNLENEMQVVDLYPLFSRRYRDGQESFLTEDDCHPNVAGHRAVAEFLYPRIVPKAAGGPPEDR